MQNQKKLTPKQEQFCQEYIIDLNATQAAIRAGYSKKSANMQSARLLANDKVRTRTAELKSKRIESTGIDAAYVLKRHHEIDLMSWAEILGDDFTVKPLSEWPKSWLQTVSALDIQELFSADNPLAAIKKIKLPCKLKNLELLGRHTAVGAYESGNDSSGAADKIAQAMLSLADSLPD